MSHKFHVGEIALAVSIHAALPRECVVLDTPRDTPWQNPKTYRTIAAGRYLISLDGEYFQAHESQLRKRPGNEYDGRQVTSWNECVWKPKTLGIKKFVLPNITERKDHA